MRDRVYEELDAYLREQEEYFDNLPKCECCDEPIQDDYYYEIDNTIICEECLNDIYRKDTDDYYQEKKEEKLCGDF